MIAGSIACREGKQNTKTPEEGLQVCAVGRFRISVAVVLTQIRVEVRTDTDFSFVSGIR